MSKSSPTTLRVKSLKGIEIGTHYEARLVEALLRPHDQEDKLMAAITDLADQCLKSDWTVYRWLRGSSKPPASPLRKLESLAKERSIALPSPDAPTDDGPDDTIDAAQSA